MSLSLSETTFVEVLQAVPDLIFLCTQTINEHAGAGRFPGVRLLRLVSKQCSSVVMHAALSCQVSISYDPEGILHLSEYAKFLNGLQLVRMCVNVVAPLGEFGVRTGMHEI